MYSGVKSGAERKEFGPKIGQSGEYLDVGRAHHLQSRGCKDKRSMNPKNTRNLNSNPAEEHKRQLV